MNTNNIELKDCKLLREQECVYDTIIVNDLYNVDINHDDPTTNMIINVDPYYDEELHSIMIPIIKKNVIAKVKLTDMVLYNMIRDIIKEYEVIFWILLAIYTYMILFLGTLL